MKNFTQVFSGKKVSLLILFVLLFAKLGYSQGVTLSTSNCVVTGNEIQFTAYVTNNTNPNSISGMDSVLSLNSFVIRFTVASAIIANSGDNIAFNYISGSDFPLLLPPNPTPAFTWSYGSHKAGFSSATNVYLSPGCCSITNLQRALQSV